MTIKASRKTAAWNRHIEVPLKKDNALTSISTRFSPWIRTICDNCEDRQDESSQTPEGYQKKSDNSIISNHKYYR